MRPMRPMRPMFLPTVSNALAQAQDTYAQLSCEAEARSLKGMCQDDFEWYAQRLTELEAHLAYLQHLLAHPPLATRPLLWQPGQPTRTTVTTVTACGEEAQQDADASCALCDAFIAPDDHRVGPFCTAACRDEAEEQEEQEEQGVRDGFAQASAYREALA